MQTCFQIQSKFKTIREQHSRFGMCQQQHPIASAHLDSIGNGVNSFGKLFARIFSENHLCRDTSHCALELDFDPFGSRLSPTRSNVCVLIKLHKTGQPGPDILIFQWYMYGSTLWGIACVCVCVDHFQQTVETSPGYGCQSWPWWSSEQGK